MTPSTATATRRTGPRTDIPTYSHAERDRRWRLARDLMDEQGLAALIVYGDREGAAPRPRPRHLLHQRPSRLGVMFPRKGDPVAEVALPMAVTDHMTAERRHEQPWIRPENINAGKMGRALVMTMKEMGLGKGTIGVIGLEPYPPFYFDGAVPYNTWSTVLESFPDASFKPVQKRFLELTAVRSDEELEVFGTPPTSGRRCARRCWKRFAPGCRKPTSTRRPWRRLPATPASPL